MGYFKIVLSLHTTRLNDQERQITVKIAINILTYIQFRVHSLDSACPSIAVSTPAAPFQTKSRFAFVGTRWLFSERKRETFDARLGWVHTISSTT